MIWAIIGASPISLWATIAILLTGSGYCMILHSVSSIGWQRHVCLDYKIPSGVYVSQNLSQTETAVILHIQIGCAVYKTIFFGPDSFSVEYNYWYPILHSPSQFYSLS